VKEIVKVPNIGDFHDVDVIEVLIAPGSVIAKDDPLLTLESDKAALEVPATLSGKVVEIFVKVGAKVSEGVPICAVEVSDAAAVTTAQSTPPQTASAPVAAPSAPLSPSPVAAPPAVAPVVAPVSSIGTASGASSTSDSVPHASPSVRRFARELGVDLFAVAASGPKNRIVQEDVQNYVKGRLAQPTGGAVAGTGLPAAPRVDFSKFGDVESRPLSRIRSKSAANLHRSWLLAPMVTQFDEADITELETFRRAQDERAKKEGYRMSLLPFIVKVVARSLGLFPDFNSSLDETAQNQILKKYINIGVAVDTPQGLVVPVVKNADRKGVVEIAKDLAELSARARDGKSLLDDFQGGNFTISSLGGIGGTAFTPIVNVPEVAILGVSRSVWKPVYQDGAFVPRLMLPLSLSYDHRVIDGANGARFVTSLSLALNDVRQLVL